MCNLYSVTKAQDAIRQLFRVTIDTAGNLPPLPDILPDQMAPVIRNGEGGQRELTRMLWGFPPPTGFGKRPVTNVRNTQSPYWRAWLKPECRVLVPLTSFCEYEDTTPRKTPTWFALSDERPLAAFAGIWRPWRGDRKGESKEHFVFSILTTKANAEVGVIHPPAMPAILTTTDEFDAWMTAPLDDALRLQRPLPDGTLRVVARGERKDEAGNHSEPTLFPLLQQGE